MNAININGKDYVMSNGEIAQFLNDNIYIDMIEGGEMEPLEAQDNALELLCEAISDEPYFGKMLLDFVNE